MVATDAFDPTGTESLEKPFVAGMYDYYLGGTANSAADRAAVEQIRAVLPEIGDVAWANRGFLQRAVRWMAEQQGIRQFIDIGAGLPTQRNTHEVVLDFQPTGRVVYADIDPRVIERGLALLGDQDNVTVIQADLREPEAILEHAAVRALIDLAEPVGLLMVAVTQFITNAEDPWNMIARYRDAVVPGSYLALSAPTGDRQLDRVTDGVVDVYKKTPTPGTVRTRAEVSRFFDGFEIIPPYPGAAPEVNFVGVWGAEDPESADDDASRWFYAAVGRKS